MDLFLVRHARAVPRDAGAVVAARVSAREWNAARALTPRGHAQLRRMVRGLDRLGVSFDRLYHSAKLRSIETANGLAELLDDDGETVTTERLSAPPGEALFAEISGDRVALVGHEPHLGALVGLLVAKGADVTLDMKPSGVVWLRGELRLGGMHVRAVLPPRVLRALARRA